MIQGNFDLNTSFEMQKKKKNILRRNVKFFLFFKNIFGSPGEHEYSVTILMRLSKSTLKQAKIE